MAYTADDPDLVETTEVDKRGRVYLGVDWAGENVRVCVEKLDV